MSDSDFHQAVFGSPIEESQKTFPFSLRLECDTFSEISSIASHFGTTKTFVVQTLLKSGLADLYQSLDHKTCTQIQAAAEAFAESLLEGE